MNRRDALKSVVGVSAGLALTAVPGQAEAGAFPAGIIYTQESQGMWAGKAATHAPVVTVADGKLTIEIMEHPMTEKHYIVRHSLVDAEGNVLGYQTFFPGDKAISTYAAPGKGTFYATSYCNQHDFWMTKVIL